MPVVSWYAEFAFRRRVSMSAIGSVIVMALWPSSPRFPARPAGRPGPPAWSAGALCARSGCYWCGRGAPAVRIGCLAAGGLPAGLGDAGQLAAVRHHPEADAAQPEPAVHRARAAAAVAPRVPAHLELRRPLRFDDQCL